MSSRLKRQGITISMLGKWLSKTERRDGCLIYLPALRSATGYGQARVVLSDGKRHSMSMHRAVYMGTYGETLSRSGHGELMVVDHLCRVRACVDPMHMELVTQRINMLRSPRSMDKQAKRELEALLVSRNIQVDKALVVAL